MEDECQDRRRWSVYTSRSVVCRNTVAYHHAAFTGTSKSWRLSVPKQI